MQFSVTFRHMEATEALKDYAKEKVQRIKKYFPDPIAVSVVMSTERYNHRADVNVQLHNGLKIAGSEATENMYSSIDLVVAKIERQVRRYKDKLRTHNKKTDDPEWEVGMEVAPDGDGADADEGPPPPRVVGKADKFHNEPLSVADAVGRLTSLDAQFLAFRRAPSGQVNVVYRREDGSYGLIEPPTPS
jgi:putative sigma-54 modulation protein